MNDLTSEDILGEQKDQISVQNYGGGKQIDGVKVVDNMTFSAEDGTFEEMVRLGEGGMFENFPDFNLQQVNRSILLPGAIKAWHLHYKQEDVWYVPPQDYILLGLWDVRKNSATSGQTQKIVLGGGKSRLVYIPRGVAHGAANFSHKEAQIIYFVNQHFNIDNPDENRLPWNAAGEEFWTPERS